MIRLRLFIAGLIFCLVLQELGAALPVVLEQTIEYAKDSSEVKEEFVCEAIKKIDLYDRLSPSIPKAFPYFTPKVTGANRQLIDRTILHRSLRI